MNEATTPDNLDAYSGPAGINGVADYSTRLPRNSGTVYWQWLTLCAPLGPEFLVT